MQPVAIDRLKMQIQTRRVAAQARDEGRQEDRLVEINSRDPHDARHLIRIERAGQLEAAGYVGQSPVNGARQLQGPGRRLHASIPQLEEAVVEKMTQPAQCLAHCWLT